MTLPNLAIDGPRLLADLYRLREFGTYKTGVHRPTYSRVDMDSRHWIMERMREAGLTPEIDGIGNVFGRGTGAGKRVLLGSHTETQPHAGWLDGALGVMYGLEVARTVGHGVHSGNQLLLVRRAVRQSGALLLDGLGNATRAAVEAEDLLAGRKRWVLVAAVDQCAVPAAGLGLLASRLGPQAQLEADR